MKLLVDASRAEVAKFDEQGEVKQIPRNKIIVRSPLGLQNPNLWINNLNIGNVMNLNPMSSEELNLREEIDLVASMETVLENCILYIVSTFCVSTEMRFQYEKQGRTNKALIDQAKRLHSKAIYFAVAFMPDQCPLVGFVVESYFKNYRQEKDKTTSKPGLETTKKLLLELINKQSNLQKPPK